MLQAAEAEYNKQIFRDKLTIALCKKGIYKLLMLSYEDTIIILQ